MTTTRKMLIALGALLLVGILAVTTGLTTSSDGQASGTDRSTAAEADGGKDVDVTSEPTATGDGTAPGREGPGGQAGGEPGVEHGRPGGAPEAQDGDRNGDDDAPGAPGGAPAPPCLSARCLGLEPQLPPRMNVDLAGPTYAGARLVRCTPRRVVDYFDFIVEIEITGVNDPSGIRSVGIRDNLTMDSAGGGTYRRAWSEPQRGGSTTIVLTDTIGNRTTVPVQWAEGACPVPPA
jgi:hypothetical protein